MDNSFGSIHSGDFIYGYQGLNEITGMSLQQLKTEIRVRDFPKPLGKVRHGKSNTKCFVWSTKQVLDWMKMKGMSNE